MTELCDFLPENESAPEKFVSRVRHPSRRAQQPATRGELPRVRINSDAARMANYGLTRERFDRMVVRSGGRCLLCTRVCRDLVVDHDHKTKRVRGLICDPCNRALMYVERHGLRLRWYRRVAMYLGGRALYPRGSRIGSRAKGQDRSPRRSRQSPGVVLDASGVPQTRPAGSELLSPSRLRRLPMRERFAASVLGRSRTHLPSKSTPAAGGES